MAGCHSLIAEQCVERETGWSTNVIRYLGICTSFVKIKKSHCSALHLWRPCPGFQKACARHKICGCCAQVGTATLKKYAPLNPMFGC